MCPAHHMSGREGRQIGVAGRARRECGVGKCAFLRAATCALPSGYVKGAGEVGPCEGGGNDELCPRTREGSSGTSQGDRVGVKNWSPVYQSSSMWVCCLITTYAGAGRIPQQHHGMGIEILKKNFGGSKTLRHKTEV